MFRTWIRRWRQPSVRSTRSQLRSTRRAGIQLEGLEDRLAPALHVWLGLANALWSNADNWICIPVPPETTCSPTPVGDPNAEIIFDPGAFNTSSVNDLGNITIRSLAFWGDNIVLSSLPNTTIRITGGITDNVSANLAPGGNRILSPLTLAGGGQHIVEFTCDSLPPPSGPPNCIGLRTLTLEGQINAERTTDSMMMFGSGELGIFGDNTFQGGFSLLPAIRGSLINSTVAVATDRALGTGQLRLQGGTLRATTPVTLGNPFLAAPDPITNTSVLGGNTRLTMSGAGTIQGGAVLQIENYNTTTFTNRISGSGSVVVDAERDPRIARGKVVIERANDYTGGTTVRSGILGIMDDLSLGTGPLTLRGGQLQSDNANTTLTVRNNFTVFGTPQIGGANSITFTGTGNLTTGATLNLANLDPAPEDPTRTSTLRLQGVLSGPGAVLKTEAGDAVLDADNTHTGRTIIRGGTLGVTRNTSLGTGVLELGGGTLRIDAPVTLANIYEVTGDSVLAGNNNVTFSEVGNFISSVTFTLTISNTATTTFLKAIGGVGAIRIDAGATGIVNFFGVSDYSGGTILVSGTVTLNSDRSLGVGLVTFSGGGLRTDRPSTLPNAILVNAPSTLSGDKDLTITGNVSLPALTNTLTITNSAQTRFTGVINGSGQIILNAAGGTLRLEGLNTHTGGTTLLAGTLISSNDLSFGSGPLTLSAGRLLPVAPVTLANPLIVNGSPLVDAANSVTFTGLGTLNGNLLIGNIGTVTFTYVGFVNLIGAGSITKQGAGTLVLTGNSESTGGVTLQGGLLRLGHGNALGTGLLTVTGGTFQADRAITVRNTVNLLGNATIGGAADFAFNGPGTMTLAANVTLTISNTEGTSISQMIRGAGALTITAGTVLLSAANTYTGVTTVTGGKLLVNGSQPSSSIRMTNATLGGNGTVGPITLRGSTLSPGLSPGILRVNGNATLDSASTLFLELNGDSPGTGFDQLIVTGILNLNSDAAAGARLLLSAGYVPPPGKTFSVIQASAGFNGRFSGLPEGSVTVVGDLTFRLSYLGGTNNNELLLSPALTNSTIVLLSLLNPSPPGQTITFSARVAAAANATGTPTGNVTFMEGQRVLGVAPLINGEARLTTTLGIGSFNIYALYSGDAVFTPSGPAQLLQKVSSDPAQPPNERFVSQLYRDLLGREPDSAGLQAFTSLLNQNQITRDGVVLTIMASKEYRENVVRDAYLRVLGREVDPLGLAGWSDFLAKGGKQDRLWVLLMDSKEFYQRAGGTGTGFLQRIYRVVLERSIDALGLQLWTARLDAGSARGALAEEILASTEANTRKVDRIYRDYLGRAPETNGLNAFVSALKSGQLTVEDVTVIVLSSGEYYLRV